MESQHVIQEINLEILRRFNEEGLEFAFPTMTIEVDGNPATDDGATPAQDAT